MKMNRAHLPALASSLLLALSLALPVAAAEHRPPETIVQAVESGEIMPLKAVLGLVESTVPGVVVDAELEHKGNAWFYEIKVIQKDATTLKLEVDARDGRIVERRTKHRQ